MANYKFNVAMSCGGCSGAITRALNKAKEDPNAGIEDFSVDLNAQTVLVNGSASLQDVQARIAKTGKEVRSADQI
ncbi:Metal homeostasis factor atx1 [Wallemia ichthyophaga EXF-994]|uniref:Metal homeostasis factor atx1 n=1 Tax=Wallemia ichthyophaga (strain EXF-994 / CBS 113033) TaxID=1299270 RepID=R9APM5_WALI9|nr:Metal homeostasis factor atx1 [Wallemia ichthyophaga EXF-994]EOR04167.1 Metal homeostasis factor atx1 [Wallemia ichthyophaga EXF-994]